MHDRPQLIAYVDRLAGDFAGLSALLDGPLAGAFAGVHALPFFDPIDGADAGFDPVDHRVVDPRLGSWDDVAALATRHELTADLIVNHVSADSPEFRDWSARGSASPHHGMFLTYDTVFPGGASEDELLAVYRPRPGLSFTAYPVAGRRRLLWTTFTPSQIDLDLDDPGAQGYLGEILDRFAEVGVRLVRLDAIGYVAKQRGTSCFLIPETDHRIDELVAACHRRGLEVLVEIHGHHRTQIDLAARVDRVYDFALGPLLLDGLFRGTTDGLADWLAIRPANAVTVLDTHDGIGMTDIGRDQVDLDRPGLLDQARIDELVEEIHRRSGDVTRAATAGVARNPDLYQVNGTYYDALGADDDAYLLARLVQVLVPGIPQIYYVGLLAGGNDVARWERTGVGRDLNRRSYRPEELATELERPVVRRLLALLRWRTADPVFAGSFAWAATGSGLRLAWTTADRLVDAHIDLASRRFAVSIDGGDPITDLVDLPVPPSAGGSVPPPTIDA